MTANTRREYEPKEFNVNLKDVTLKENRLEFTKDGKLYTCPFTKCRFALNNKEDVKAFFVRKFAAFSQYPNAIIRFYILPADKGIEPLYCAFFHRSSMHRYFEIVKVELKCLFNPYRLMLKVWNWIAFLIFRLTGNPKQLFAAIDSTIAYYDAKFVELKIKALNDK